MTKEYTPTIAVDFDGVIHSYTSGWKGATVIPDPPVPGAIEFLTMLTESHRLANVVIFSSRAKTWRGRRAIKSWLQEHSGVFWGPDGFNDGIKSIKVTAEKPPAVVYLDDRAVRFEGEFPDTTKDLRKLLEMRTWNK